MRRRLIIAGCVIGLALAVGLVTPAGAQFVSDMVKPKLKLTGSGTQSVLSVEPSAPLRAGPSPRIYVADTASDADRNGDFITVKSNDPGLPRDVFRLTRLGGVLLWDWLAVAPQANRLLMTPGNGAMLSVASDLGANGTTVALTTSSAQGDYVQINGYSASGFDAAVRKFTFADTNIGGSWDSPGIFVLGTKTAASPGLKKDAATGWMQVRAGDDSGLSIIEAGAYFFGTSGTVSIGSGAGTPEGVRSAPVGSLWLRTDGGAGTTLYVKQSGTGNTGWVGK